MGVVASRKDRQLRVRCPELLSAVRVDAGDSIAVNGVCLTAEELQQDGFVARLLEATLQDTTLGALSADTLVNLEPALRAGDPLGGHLVQGHVDGTTSVIASEKIGDGFLRLRFALPGWLRTQIVPKGSITVDGVSLTVQRLESDWFAVELIPATLEATTLGRLQPGIKVNLEADLIVKTVARLLEFQPHMNTGQTSSNE